MKLSKNFDLIQKNTSHMIDLWMYNFARNIPDFLNGNNIKQLSLFNNGKKSIKKHKPNNSALVIGAGPSIKENNHLKILANSDYNGAIVCTDRMLIPCLKNGITPEKFSKFYVLTVEPKDVTIKFYDNKIIRKYGKGISAVLSTCTRHETVELCKKNGLNFFWFHPLIDDFRKLSSVNKTMNMMSKSEKTPKGLLGMQTGGNVGCFGWIFSWAILGCSPVAVIGLDLGHPADTPIKNTRHYDEYCRIFKNDKTQINKYFKKIINTDLKTKVLSDPIFDFYREAFLDLVTRTPKWVRTINSTEGGSLFGIGIKNMKLEDFLK